MREYIEILSEQQEVVAVYETPSGQKVQGIISNDAFHYDEYSIPLFVLDLGRITKQ